MAAAEIDSRADGAGVALRHRRSRWPRRVIGTTAALLVVLMASWWVGANVIYYQPLHPGPWDPGPSEGATRLSLVGDDFAVIPVHADAEFRVGTSITNGGDHPITISDVSPMAPYFYFEPTATLMVPADSYIFDDLRPFEPFDLAPNESAWVGHLYRFRDCPFPWSDPRPLHQRLEDEGMLLVGGYMSWTDIDVEFSVRGWTRHTSVELRPTPIIDGVGGECPAAEEALATARD